MILLFSKDFETKTLSLKLFMVVSRPPNISFRTYCNKVVEIIMSDENKEELINQLTQKIELNKNIINGLKEFFGSYLSDFLKMYRNTEEEHDEKLKEILAHQDKLFSKFHEVMKER